MKTLVLDFDLKGIGFPKQAKGMKETEERKQRNGKEFLSFFGFHSFSKITETTWSANRSTNGIPIMEFRGILCDFRFSVVKRMVYYTTEERQSQR